MGSSCSIALAYRQGILPPDVIGVLGLADAEEVVTRRRSNGVKRIGALLFILGIGAIATPTAHAAWTPFAVSQAPGAQQVPVAVTDGAGGAIVAWIDDRSGSQAIYAQRVRTSDNVDPAWPANGLLVGPVFYDFRIVAEGAGGAIVVGAASATDIRAYHVLSTGVLDPAWPAGGVLVRTGTSNQFSIVPVTDGAGGVVIAWSDERNSATSGVDIYAQRVRSTGVTDPAWPINGTPICTELGDQSLSAAVSDGSGGSIAVWSDYRNVGFDVYAQRVLSTGVVDPGWPAGGRELCGAPNDQSWTAACSDGAGGAIAVWQDNRDSPGDIYAMRVRANGNLAPGWAQDGELVCDGFDVLTPTDVIADGAGGALMAWFSSSDANVYAQKITSSGTLPWGLCGVEVSAAPVGQFFPVLALDGSGGVYVAWADGRYWSQESTQSFLFLHHVLSSGTPDPAWPVDGGRASYVGLPNFFDKAMVANGAGGATVIWGDGDNDLFALNITSTWTPLLPLNVTAAPPSAGTVTRNPDLPAYAAGSTVTMTAVPGSGHTFIAWGGDASGSANPVMVTMDAAKNVTAIFDGYPVNVTVSPNGAGSVTRDPNQSLYPPGTQVTLTANSAGGFQFASWSGDATGTSNPTTITLDGIENVTANFSLAPPTCGNWSPTVTAVSPTPRVLAPTVWDTPRHRVLLFGGFDSSNLLNDVWQFTVGGGWMQVVTAGTPPSPRDAAGLIYDPVRDRLLVVCGNADPTPPNDVVALSLSGAPTWSPLLPTGTPPMGRFGFSTIYDPIRDRVLLFGGYPNSNEVWALSLAGTPAWTQLFPTGTPPFWRYMHAAVYDALRDRMIIHGGATANQVILNETWALDLASSSWIQLAPGGAPPRVYQSAATYDPIRDQMLLVAGLGDASSGADQGPVWSLSLEVQPIWRILPVGGVPLGPRYYHSAVYEPELDVVLAFNGLSFGSIYLNDAKRLDCAGGWWLQTGGAHGTVTAYPHKPCYENDEVVTLQAVGQSGYGLQQWLGDASGTNPLIDVTMNDHKTIVAQFHTASVGVEEPALAFALEEIRPNPNPGPIEVSYALPQAARVKLGIYDLAGRQVSRLVDGVQPAGRHHATWNGRVGGAAATSGVYFVRYETPVGSWVRKVALIR